MEEDYLSEHLLFNKSDNKRQPIKWVRKDYRGNEQIWYSEDIVSKYLTTLQEIKAIAENCYDHADKENDGFYTILQLITKAEEE